MEDENTTKKIYLHVTKEMKKEASSKFLKLSKRLLYQFNKKYS